MSRFAEVLEVDPHKVKALWERVHVGTIVTSIILGVVVIVTSLNAAIDGDIDGASGCWGTSPAARFWQHHPAYIAIRHIATPAQRSGQVSCQSNDVPIPRGQ